MTYDPFLDEMPSKIRQAWIIARMQSGHLMARYPQSKNDVLNDAKTLGYLEHLAGRNQTPCIFRDLPILTEAWKDGQTQAELTEELANIRMKKIQSEIVAIQDSEIYFLHSTRFPNLELENSVITIC